jgi:hypothetical protein
MNWMIVVGIGAAFIGAVVNAASGNWPALAWAISSLAWTIATWSAESTAK